MRKSVISTILYSVNSICHKKSMGFAKISEFLYTWLRETRGLPISLILILIFGFDMSVLTRKVVIGVPLIVGIVQIYSNLDQNLYRKEKLSNILPYENLYAVFSIIAGFLIFRDTSRISFVIAIVTFLVILAFSFDLKKLTIPKSFKTILIIQFLLTVEVLLTGRFLQSVSDTQYYVLYEVVVLILLLFPILTKSSFKDLKKTTKPFYGYLMGGALSSHLARLLYLFTVGEFWVVMSTLLSFLGTGLTLLFGRIVLKEKPTKKNIIMCVIVAILVGLGYRLG